METKTLLVYLFVDNFVDQHNDNIVVSIMSHRHPLDCIDLNAKTVAVGFMMQADEARERVRDGTSDMGDVNKRFIKEANDSWFLLRMIPDWMKTDAFNQYWSTMRFKHCELGFFIAPQYKEMFEDRSVVSLRVVADTTVHVKTRIYMENKDYKWLYFPVEHKNLRAMIQWIRQQIGKPFSIRRMLLSTISPCSDDQESYYCVYLTMSALKFLPVVCAHFNAPTALSVDDFYSALMNDAARAEKSSHVIYAKRDQSQTELPVSKEIYDFYQNGL